jgi:ATP-dependent DNA helicase RecG
MNASTAAGFEGRATGLFAVGNVLVEIRKSSDVKHASNGTVYLRHGAQGLPIDTDEKLRRLQLDKGFATFESETLNVEFQVITESDVTHSFITNVVPTSET